jgi:hypothetical protein
LENNTGLVKVYLPTFIVYAVVFGALVVLDIINVHLSQSHLSLFLVIIFVDLLYSAIAYIIRKAKGLPNLSIFKLNSKKEFPIFLIFGLALVGISLWLLYPSGLAKHTPFILLTVLFVCTIWYCQVFLEIAKELEADYTPDP